VTDSSGEYLGKVVGGGRICSPSYWNSEGMDRIAEWLKAVGGSFGRRSARKDKKTDGRLIGGHAAEGNRTGTIERERGGRRVKSEAGI